MSISYASREAVRQLADEQAITNPYNVKEFSFLRVFIAQVGGLVLRNK